MQKIINGEQPFQVLSTNFTIGPSESGYDLYFSADGREYSKLFTVAANTNRQVTQVAAGSYYYLEGNTDTAVTVNWIANCYSGGEGGGGSYVLPVASSDTLGGVKVGSGMTIAEDGTLSANPGGYTLPAATDSTLGGVKVGSGLTIDANGVLSVSGGTDGPKELVVSLGDLHDMSSSELKAAWDDIYAKYVSGYTVYVEGGVVNKNGYTVRIPLVEAIPETNPETHSGGWLYFGGIYGDNAYYGLSFNSTGNISGNGTGPTNGKKFEAKTVYSLPTASTSTKGGVKVGSGLTIDSEKLSVNIGDGLAFSGNTIVVSGGTGGGIEKVTELPANPEEGDIVQLYVSGKTVQTIAMEMTNSEKSYENSYQVAVINGNNFDCDGYGTLYGKWVHNGDFNINLRNRRSADYRYFDFEVDAADIELGSDADSLTATQIPGYYQIWAFENGAWKQIDREIVFDPQYDGNLTDFFWRVYSGVNFIDTDYITIRIKDQGNTKREFKPYDFKYYGMDCQATDGRGAEDGHFGQVGIETVRVNNDGWGMLTGKAYTAKASDIPDIAPVSFGNDGRGGLTFDADNDQFLYDNGTVATGDTSNYVEDVIDFAYLNSLFNRDGKYEGFRYLINSHVLNVQSSGATNCYTQPSLAKKPITGYTIGDYTFVWEFTFKYSDYVLRIDAPDGNNIGANLRITQA